MQNVEKVFGLSLDDFSSIVPAAKSAIKTSKTRYFKETPLKLQMLDNLILLSIATFVVQAVYGVLFNRDPFNSFIAGVFCSLGTFSLAASLRIQLSEEEFSDYPPRKMIFEYIIGQLLVFFACLILMG